MNCIGALRRCSLTFAVLVRSCGLGLVVDCALVAHGADGGTELAGLFRSDTSGGSISLNASIFANKGPQGLAGTDCAGVRGSLASPRPYCVYPHGWCARPVRLSRGTQSLLRRAWPATTLRNNGSILPEPIEAVGAQLGTPHRVHDVAVAQEVSLRGAPSGSDLWTVMAGAPTSLGRARDGARAGGRRSFCRHSGGQGVVNRPNERSVIRQQDELCRS